VTTGFDVVGSEQPRTDRQSVRGNLFGKEDPHRVVTRFIKSRLLFDSRIEFLPVSHGPGLRLEAILLRRATMIIMITTNRTPAMMRIVVGSIEALSLKYMRHGFRYGLCRILQNWALPLKRMSDTKIR